MKRIWLIGMMISGLMALNPQSALAVDSTWAPYFDIAGTEGLSVVAYFTSGCTGTPPAVTPGGTAYAFTDYGSGRYARKLAEGEYHLFVAGEWQAAFYHATSQNKNDITTIQAPNWVTLTRMADASAGSAELVDGGVANVDLANNCVTSAKVLDGTLLWLDLSATIKGATCDTLFTIGKMQDTLRAMKGNWNGGTDYNLDQVDSILKTVVLNLAFAPPCTVRIATQGLGGGVRVIWQMNSSHNDSAVQKYRVYWGVQAPTFYSSGELDSQAVVLLTSLTEGSFEISPRRWVNSFLVPVQGLLYVVVTAVDWQGTIWGSAWDSARTRDAGVGTVATLVGAPGYSVGMDGMTALRDAMTQIDQLKNQLEKTVNPGFTRQMLWVAGTTAAGAANDAADDPSVTDLWIETASGFILKRSLVFVQTADMRYLRMRGAAKVESGGSGRLHLEAVSGVVTGDALYQVEETAYTDFALDIDLQYLCPVTAPTKCTVNFYMGDGDNVHKFLVNAEVAIWVEK